MAHMEKQISREVIFEGRILTLVRDRVELEDGTKSAREIVLHSGGAGVFAMTADRQVYMVRQYRYAFGQELLEIPAGKLEPGEPPEKTAARELEEECGLKAAEMIPLGAVYPSVGYDGEIIHLYLAEGLRQTERKPDAGEFLSVETIPYGQLLGMADDGRLRDAKTVTAIYRAGRRLGLI